MGGRESPVELRGPACSVPKIMARTRFSSTSGVPPRISAIARWAPLGAALILLALGYAFGLHHYLTLEAIRRHEAELSALVERNVLAAAAAYVLAYVLAVSLSFPGASILTMVGGFMFGCLIGTLLAVISATAGATVIFLAARTSLGALLARRAGPRMQRLTAGLREDGFKYLLFLRLVPIFPFWLVNLAAGVFGMRLASYVAATAIGIVPATFLFSYFGERLGTALDTADVPLALKLGLALLGVLALLPVLVRRWWGGRGKRDAPS
jgi:uncharacterized membrane protein YdjX (TVP38/TMEM64 family)